MADQSELRMNIVAIRRVDPYAKDIVESSAHVAFYTFNSEISEWEKTDVEGAFFIYSRTAEPYYNIFINNRLNTQSLVEPITNQLELQSQPPFLLYRNERSRIRGFWFYTDSECVRIGSLIEKIAQNCDKNSNYKEIPNIMSGQQQSQQQQQPQQQQSQQQQQQQHSNKNVDIFSMLTKAQEEFNNSVGVNPQSSMLGLIAPAQPTRILDKMQHPSANPDVTSQSVMNFFAAAKPSAGAKPAAAAAEVPFFQRMLSAPVPVDQIEKHQRTATPQEKNSSPPQNNYNMISTVMCSAENSYGVGFMRIHSPSQRQEFGASSPMTTFINTNLSVTRPHGTTNENSGSDHKHQPLQELLKKDGEQNNVTPIKPALMLPTMFSVNQKTSSGAETTTSSATILQQHIAEPIPLTVAKQSEQILSVQPQTKPDQQSKSGQPEPLTQSQLLQAMSYLIKNDPDFVKKLHEAYLKSFTEMVSL